MKINYLPHDPYRNRIWGHGSTAGTPLYIEHMNGSKRNNHMLKNRKHQMIICPCYTAGVIAQSKNKEYQRGLSHPWNVINLTCGLCVGYGNLAPRKMNYQLLSMHDVWQSKFSVPPEKRIQVLWRRVHQSQLILLLKQEARKHTTQECVFARRFLSAWIQ